MTGTSFLPILTRRINALMPTHDLERLAFNEGGAKKPAYRTFDAPERSLLTPDMADASVDHLAEVAGHLGGSGLMACAYFSGHAPKRFLAESERRRAGDSVLLVMALHRRASGAGCQSVFDRAVRLADVFSFRCQCS